MQTIMQRHSNNANVFAKAASSTERCLDRVKYMYSSTEFNQQQHVNWQSFEETAGLEHMCNQVIFPV